jgi:DnaJ family protein C protein 2
MGRRREAERAEAEAALKGMSKADLGKKVAAMREWEEEEMRMLDRALVKFPQVRMGKG